MGNADNEKKLVLKLDVHDEKGKQKAMKAVSGLTGISSMSMDLKDGKMTVVGSVDPIKVVRKLRKVCHAEIVLVGPAKEPEKKNEPKKEDAKKDEPKKDPNKEIAELAEAYKAFNPHPPMYYYVQSVEQNPNWPIMYW